MTDLELKVHIYAHNNREILEGLLKLNEKRAKAQDIKTLDAIFQELAEANRNIVKARRKRN